MIVMHDALKNRGGDPGRQVFHRQLSSGNGSCWRRDRRPSDEGHSNDVLKGFVRLAQTFF
jgi:hypothetical protein